MGFSSGNKWKRKYWPFPPVENRFSTVKWWIKGAYVRCGRIAILRYTLRTVTNILIMDSEP